MSEFEYRVVPAPTKGLRGRGIKGPQARFANALQTVMNDLGADGWEYLRTDTLPAEERQGLTSRVTVFQNMLVFRRALATRSAAPEFEPPRALPAPSLDEADNVTPLFSAQSVGAALQATQPDEPANYDGPDLNPALLARAQRLKSPPAAE
ncbi:MAG: DUF4177 domain-containing protein [Pseudomonadota bacterium]